MAGGFMSGFGESFSRTFNQGVDTIRKEKADDIKTRMAFALEQKTAYEKAKAKDAAYVKQAEDLAAQVDGAPRDAWKTAYDAIKSGRTPEKILEELRAGTFTQVDTTAPVKEAVEGAKEASVDEQMSDAMGEPTPTAESPTDASTKPAESGGIVTSIKDWAKGRDERIASKRESEALEKMGATKEEYDAWVSGYTSDVDTSEKSYKFTVAKDDSEAKNFSQALYQMAIKDPAYIKAKEEGDLATQKRILDTYAKQGTTTTNEYDWKGTKASLLDLKDNAQRNLNSSDPATANAAKLFLEVRYPQIISENPTILTGTASTKSDPKEEFARLNREIATIQTRMGTATGEELTKLQEQLATLSAARDVEQGSIKALEIMKSDTATVDVIVRDEAAGVNRTIKANKVADPSSPSGFRLENEAGQPITLVRVASEEDKTTIASFKSLSDEIAKFNTETVPKAGNVMSVGLTMSQALRKPNGNALTNNLGGLANVAESIKQNFSVAANMVGVVFNEEKDSATGKYVKRITADQWAQQYNYNSLEEMAIDRDNFEANTAALAYLVAEAMFGQAGRGLSDTDLIKAYEYIGAQQFNNPQALANRIDEIMVTYMDNTNAKGRSFAILGPVKAYQEMLGSETVPEVAKTISIQDYAATTPESTASQAVKYYTEVAPQFRRRSPSTGEQPKVDPKTVRKLTQSVVDGIKMADPAKGAQLQEMLDNGATGFRVQGNSFVPVK